MNRPHSHLTLVSSEGRLLQVDIPSEGLFLLHETDLFPMSFIALQWSPQGEARRTAQHGLSHADASAETQEVEAQIEQTAVSDLIQGFAEDSEREAAESQKGTTSGRLLGRIINRSCNSDY